MAEIKKKILIVDDDIALADVLLNRFKIEDFDVAMAQDGQAAMDRLEKETFDLVLLDLNMPWFDGFQVLAELQKRQFKTPVVIMSSLAGVADINRAKTLGAVDYLVKSSVTPDLIVKEIRQYIQ